MPTPESLIRRILARAIEDGLVAPMAIAELPGYDPDPQARTDEELSGCVREMQRIAANNP